MVQQQIPQKYVPIVRKLEGFLQVPTVHFLYEYQLLLLQDALNILDRKHDTTGLC